MPARCFLYARSLSKGHGKNLGLGNVYGVMIEEEAEPPTTKGRVKYRDRDVDT